MFMTNGTQVETEAAMVEAGASVVPAEGTVEATPAAPEVVLPKTKAQLKEEQRIADIDMGMDALLDDLVMSVVDLKSVVADLRGGLIEGKAKAKKVISDLRDNLFHQAHRFKTAGGMVTAFGEAILPTVASQSPAANVTAEDIAKKIADLQKKYEEKLAAERAAAEAAIAQPATEVPTV